MLNHFKSNSYNKGRPWLPWMTHKYEGNAENDITCNLKITLPRCTWSMWWEKELYEKGKYSLSSFEEFSSGLPLQSMSSLSLLSPLLYFLCFFCLVLLFFPLLLIKVRREWHGLSHVQRYNNLKDYTYSL